MAELNNMQEQIVNHTEGPVIVLAGAGSGKTRVLTYRIANIVKNSLAYPNQILAITFTNKAAEEMRIRLNAMNIEAEKIWAQTFHSFCAKVLRYEASAVVGYNEKFTIYDEIDKKNVVKKILKVLKLEEEKYLNDALNRISQYKSRNISLQDYALEFSYLPDLNIIISILRNYEISLKNNNAMDFDDLLSKCLEVFKNNPDILAKWQNRFKYILIDEFQDTNPVQYEIVYLLSKNHKNIFAVGDEDQSIYSWRGASLDNIKHFMHDFPSYTLYKLEQNYRSSKNIIDCANIIIKKNANRIDKTLWTEKDKGAEIQFSRRYNDVDEAKYVVQEIYRLTHDLGYKNSDIAVLMRLNALTRSFEEQFLSYNIPYQIFGGVKFYERSEIKNILAYLKLLVNPRDDESFYRVINYPKRGIGEVAIKKLQAQYGTFHLMQSVLDLPDDSKEFAKFIPFKNMFISMQKKLSTMKITDFVEYLILVLNLRDEYKAENDEDSNRWYNIQELIRSIQQFEKLNEDATVVKYLQQVSLTTDLDAYEESNDKVILATVHSAKGLEFKCVFIVGLEDKYFPIIRADTDSSKIEEERRLMYVAITRAKERLFLTYASQRYMYGKYNISMPSRFLNDLGLNKPTQPTQSYERKSFGKVVGYGTAINSVFTNGYTPTSNKPSQISQNSVSSDLQVGDKVSHVKFGVGTITQYDKSSDILMVNFEGFGNKLLSAKFAPIHKVN